MADQVLEQPPSVRLTAFSHGAGCACKLGPGELSDEILAAARESVLAMAPAE